MNIIEDILKKYTGLRKDKLGLAYSQNGVKYWWKIKVMGHAEFDAAWLKSPGPWFNIKIVFPRCEDSYAKDKTVLNMGIPILVRRHLYI